MRFALLVFYTVLAVARAEEFRVLTFNIRYDRPDPGVRAWAERRETVAAILRANADLAGLQEVLPNQRRELLERCPEFAFVGVGREPGDGGEASPVLVRRERFTVLESGTFWFSDTPEIPGSKSWGNDLPRICTWAKLREVRDGAVLWFFNVHLDHRSQPSRERSAALLLERIEKRASSEPVLLTGDFNAEAENPAIKALTQAPGRFASSFTAAGMASGPTFHDFTGRAGAGAIDFIFVDPQDWEVSKTEVLKASFRASDGTEAWPSDHFPIKAVLARRDSRRL